MLFQFTCRTLGMTRRIASPRWGFSSWMVAEERRFKASADLIGMVFLDLIAKEVAKTWKRTRRDSMAAAIDGVQLRCDQNLGEL